MKMRCPRTPDALPIRRHSSGQGAFTLIELLVAMTVTAILALVLASVFLGVSKSFNQVEGRASAYRDARAALRLIEDELAALVDPRPPRVGDALEDSQSPPPVQLTEGDHPSLAFLTKVDSQGQPKNENQSDVCLVGYFTADDPTSHRTALYRVLISSQQTYERLKSGNKSLLQDTDRDPKNPQAEPVADNVIAFQARLLDRSEKEIVSDSANPAFVEIELKVVGPRSGQAYFEPGASEALRKKIEREDARSFTARFRIRSLGADSP